ncbi:MAG: TRAM domain-containing protein [Deinococcales bacterium]
MAGDLSELAVRSSFIVGFPGDGRRILNCFWSFERGEEIERVGAFRYSEVKSAHANTLPDHIPEEIKEERYDRLMRLQQAISAEILKGKMGQELEVIIDDYSDIPGEVIGRSHYDAPGIDGKVYVSSDGSAKIGDIVKVKIHSADSYDLYGDMLSSVKWQPNVPLWTSEMKH